MFNADRNIRTGKTIGFLHLHANLFQCLSSSTQVTRASTNRILPTPSHLMCIDLILGAPPSMPFRLLRPGRGTNKLGMAMAMKHDLMGSVLIILSLCTPIRFAAADPETSIVWCNCEESGNYTYTNGSAFQINLNKLLDSLVKNVYATGFNISSVEGQNNSSTVYGLVQCRGDLGSSDCKQCASNAKANLVQGCHNTSGFIQLDGCFLRYDDHNFYNDIESTKDTTRIILCNTENSGQPQQFTTAASVLFLNDIAKAAQSPDLFAVDSVASPSNSMQNIYSLAQCWRDLSRTNCGLCLTYVYENIFHGCQPGALGAQFGSQNCHFRYEVYEFFNATVLSPPPRESPPASSGKLFFSGNTRVL